MKIFFDCVIYSFPKLRQQDENTSWKGLGPFSFICDKLIGKVASGDRITQTSVPHAKMSSPQEQHLSALLPVANIKTRQQSYGPK